MRSIWRREKQNVLTRQDSLMLRGSAILLVVCAHYSQEIILTYPIVPWTYLSRLGRYGVALFFLVSGYGTTKSIFSLSKAELFIAKRWKGVYVPYFILQTFTLLISLLCNSIPEFGSKKDVMKWTICHYIGIEHWYIFVILWMYLFVYGAFKFFRQYYLPVVFLLVTGLNIVLYLVGAGEIWFITNYVFVVGAMLAKMDGISSLFQKHMWKCAGTCFALWVVVFTLCSRVELLFLVYLLKMLKMLLFAVLAYIFVLNMEIYSKLLGLIGEMTLYAYVLHMYLLRWTEKYITNIFIAAGIAVILTIGIGYISKKTELVCKTKGKKGRSQVNNHQKM